MFFLLGGGEEGLKFTKYFENEVAQSLKEQYHLRLLAVCFSLEILAGIMRRDYLA